MSSPCFCSVCYEILQWQSIHGHKILEVKRSQQPPTYKFTASHIRETIVNKPKHHQNFQRTINIFKTTSSQNVTENENFVRKHSRLKDLDNFTTRNKRSFSKNKMVPKIITKQNHTLNFTAAEIKQLTKLYNDLSTERQMKLDALRAYFCIVFIILVICLASWYAGICKIRKYAVFEFDVVDFEGSQPLTTVKDTVIRKSRYLPMFEKFYRTKKKNTIIHINRGTNP